MEPQNQFTFPNTPLEITTEQSEMFSDRDQSYIDSGLSGSEYNYSSKSTPNTSLINSKFSIKNGQNPSLGSTLTQNNFSKQNYSHLSSNNNSGHGGYSQNLLHIANPANFALNQNWRGQRPLSSSSERSNSSIASSGLGLSFNSFQNSQRQQQQLQSQQNNQNHQNHQNNHNHPVGQLKQTHKLYKTIHKQTRKREIQQQKDALKSLKVSVDSAPRSTPISSREIDNVDILKIDNRISSPVHRDQEKAEDDDQPGSANYVPLPNLAFIDQKKLWNSMVKRSKKQAYNINFNKHNSNHPQVTPKMRAVLIDWLIDVCQVYQLHRETFHISLDFLARYMANTTKPIKRQTLQLVGVTSLFTASKLEEIHPPKAKDFAYVTDGACSIEQIKSFEMELCQTLNWNLQPVTAQSWLALFLQIAQFKKNNINTELIVINPSLCDLDISCVSISSGGQVGAVGTAVNSPMPNLGIGSSVISGSNNNGSNNNSNMTDVNGDRIDKTDTNSSIDSSGISLSSNSIMSPKVSRDSQGIRYEYHGSYNGQELKYVDPVLTNFQLFRYPQKLFVQMCQLLDFAMMDLRSLRFSYSVLAASCLYHFSSADLVAKCTGYKITDISYCIEWMSAHAEIVRDKGLAELRSFQRSVPLDYHNIQTHDNKLDDLLRLLKHAKNCEQEKQPSRPQRQPVPESEKSEKPERKIKNSAFTPVKSSDHQKNNKIIPQENTCLTQNNEYPSSSKSMEMTISREIANISPVETSSNNTPRASNGTVSSYNGAAIVVEGEGESDLEGTIKSYKHLKI